MHRNFSALLLVCATAICAPLTAAEAIPVFKNGELSAADTCAPWGIGDAAKIPGVQLVRDTKEFASAPAAMRLDIAGPTKAVSITQNFASVPSGEFTVLVKAKSTGAWSVKLITQQFDDGWKQVGWDETEFQPVPAWATYALSPHVADHTRNIIFYVTCSGSGSVWLDDLGAQSGKIDPTVPRDLAPPSFDAAAEARPVGRSAPVVNAGTAAYRWRNAPMGGVEYATGMIWSPRHPQALFLRADGGGCWRLERERNFFWRNLCDQTPWSDGDYAGCESLAVDAASPDILYRSAGGGRWSKAHDVMKSVDGGRTWTHTHLLNAKGEEVMSDPNGPDKQGGERLMADPNRAGTVWFATRRDGLFRSDDAAATWQAVPFPAHGGDDCGLTFVALDWQHATQGSATRSVFIGVHAGNGAQGEVWHSADGGATWRRLEGGPTSSGASVLRGRIAAWTTWVGDRAGIWVWKDGSWRDATPSAGKGKPFCGINFHPSDPLQILAATTYGENGANHVFYSKDGGVVWTDYAWDKDHPERSTIDARHYVAWDAEGAWGGNASDVAFDPLDGKHVYHTSFAGPARLDGVGTPKVTAVLIGDGREQFTCSRCLSPSKGAPLISGIWDLGGMRHERLDAIPGQLLPLKKRDGSTGFFQDIFDMDQNPDDPDHFVVCGGWQWNMTGDAAFSSDNGRTMTSYPRKPFTTAMFGRIAVGTDWRNANWVPMGLDKPLFWTKDNGATWKPGIGSPLGMVREDGAWTFYKMIAADRVRPGVFYLYDRRDGRVYRSEDGGEHWQHTARLPTQPADQHWVMHHIQATPWKAGDVWVGISELADNHSPNPGPGLYHSVNAGEHWERIEGVSWVVAFGFGVGPKPGVASMYLFGQVGGSPAAERRKADVRMWRSDDGGRSWRQISDPGNGLAGIAAGISGCFQRYGRVYVTTSNRGIMIGEPTN